MTREIQGPATSGQNRHKLPFQIATGDEIWVYGYEPQKKNIAEIQNELQEVSGNNLNPESRCREQYEMRWPGE
jgi:hypothetical protein